MIEQQLYRTTWHLWTDQVKKFLVEQSPVEAKCFIYLPECILFKGGDYTVQKTSQYVNLQTFKLAIFPVTNLQYELFDPTHERCKYSDKADQPVVNVSWQDAVKYCDWLSRQTGKTFRLPTEAEWEFAASGGGKREYPWGNEQPTPERANYADSKIGKTTPVGRYPAGKTPEGLFDMAGNVWEWCEDYFDVNQNGRVLRGGSFVNSLVDLRCAVRDGLHPDDRLNDVGFRVVRAS